MQSLTKLSKDVWLKNLAITSLVLALLLFCGHAYVRVVQNNLWESSVNNAYSLTAQGRNNLQRQVLKDYEEANLIKHLYAQNAESIEKKNINAIMGRKQERKRRFLIVDDISDYDDNFRDLLRQYGNKQQGMLPVHISNSTGLSVFDIYVKGVDKKGHEFYVLKEYSVRELTDEFLLSFYDEQGFSYMVNKDGRIILRPTHPNSNKTMQNLFDTFDKETDKEVVQNLRHSLAANENGWTEVMINGQSTLVCYASMEKSLGWSIVTLIPNSVINAEADAIIQNTLVLLAAVVLGILILTSVYIWQYKHYRAIQDSLLAAEHANQAKRAFLSTISHDVRTPLNGIIGMLDIAYMNIDNRAKLLECMGKIKTASNHLTELINQVLDMSRIESGKLNLQHEQMNVAELLQESVTIVQPLSNNKHHELSLIVDVEHKQVLGDSIQLKQIFINLITNAIKYTENGGKIAVSLQELDITQDKKQLYQLVVEDNGLGMSEEFQKHIFEPFSRVQDSTTSGIQGTGLGMAIMKRIVDLMQGHIELESALGKGSKFTITIPLEIVVEKQAEAKAQAAADLSIFKGKHVLLVDDVELNREIGEYILSSAGFEVTALEDGKHAYEYMQQAKPGEVDLILMDLMMPIMDGYTAARLIRNLPDKAVAHVPIVALTANAFEDTKKDVLAAGMNGHLAKPINKDELYKNLAGFFLNYPPSR